MKNTVIVFILFYFFSTILSSCKDDKEFFEPVNIDPVEKKILDFKEKMKNFNKQYESMTVDSAVWYIEAALNYSNCIASEDIIGTGLNFYTYIDTIMIDIEICENQIEFIEITDKYNFILDEMETLLESINFDVKFYNTIDVEIEGDKIISRCFIKYNNPEYIAGKYFYNITDSWYPGYNHGNCSHTIFNRDLIDEINKWLSYNRAVPANTYYTDIITEGQLFTYNLEVLDLFASSFPPPNNYFYNVWSPSHPIQMFMNGPYEIVNDIYTMEELFGFDCVSVQDGNYFAQQSNLAIEWAIDNIIASNRDFTGCFITEWRAVRGWETTKGDWYRQYYPMHRMYVYSGIPHTGGGQQN